VRELPDEALEELDLRFTCFGFGDGSDALMAGMAIASPLAGLRQQGGHEHELIPGGRDVRVTRTGRREYLRLCEQFRLGQCARQCAAMARGLATQVPRHLLSLYTWEECAEMVCGPPDIDVAQLRTYTLYGEGYGDRHATVGLFWRCLEEFSQEERQKYVRFVWGPCFNCCGCQHVGLPLPFLNGGY